MATGLLHVWWILTKWTSVGLCGPTFTIISRATYLINCLWRSILDWMLGACLIIFLAFQFYLQQIIISKLMLFSSLFYSEYIIIIIFVVNHGRVEICWNKECKCAGITLWICHLLPKWGLHITWCYLIHIHCFLFKVTTLTSADQACLHYKWKCLSKGIVSLCWSVHIRNMPSPSCSFIVCGM